MCNVSTTTDQMELYDSQILSSVKVSKAAANMSPADLLLLQIKFVCQACDLQMLRVAAGAVQNDYARLTNKAKASLPRPKEVVERFNEKVGVVAKTLDDMKGSSEFMVNEDGAQAIIITEADLESSMDNLARELRTWSEAQIVEAGNTQASRVAHLENLLRVQENKTDYCNYLLQMQKKSFSRRVDADIIDKHYQLLLDMDTLKRKLKQAEEDMMAQEPTLRNEIRAEFTELVGELTAKLAASKARFLEFHRQMTTKALKNLSEVKRETMQGMKDHKVTPAKFKAGAQQRINELEEIEEAQDEVCRGTLPSVYNPLQLSLSPQPANNPPIHLH